jgi:hypothetical protein
MAGRACFSACDVVKLLPIAITEIVIAEGSTVPIRMTHAGIVRLVRYSFDLS